LVRPANHTVSSIDENHLLYGNFIGLQYLFAKGLDAGVLARSVEYLIKQVPVLSGRYDAKVGAVLPSQDTVTLNIQSHSEPRRRDVLRGKAPLSTFSLAESEAGATLGMAISHLLTDAAGFHMLVRHLGDIYSALMLGRAAPDFPFIMQLDVFEFGTERSKSEVFHDLKRRQLPKPIPIKGFPGWIIKSLIIKAMDKSIQDNPPVRIHFSSDGVTRLKQAVLTESGEDWISTNVALCAHFASIIAKLSYGDKVKTEMQIGQLLDLRNRYFETDSKAQSNYLGNAILIHIDRAKFPDGLQNTSRGALASYFKQRQTKTDPTDVKDRLDLLADCLRYGFTNPELDVKNPIISLNNQSKMPVYDVRFDGQGPTCIYPQDVGDNIMFFPAHDGGIDIHIRDIVNPLDQQKLLTPEWQERIFDF